MAYERWAVGAATDFARLFDGFDWPDMPITDAERLLLGYLAPTGPRSSGLPYCLRPEQKTYPTDEQTPAARLIRALYAPATTLAIYVDARDLTATILLVGIKDQPPHHYLLSISREHAPELVVSSPKDLRSLHSRITAAMAQVG